MTMSDFILGLSVGMMLGGIAIVSMAHQWRSSIEHMSARHIEDIDQMHAIGRAALLEMSAAWQADVERLTRRTPPKPEARA